jgi:hypothetical protein
MEYVAQIGYSWAVKFCCEHAADFINFTALLPGFIEHHLQGADCEKGKYSLKKLLEVGTLSDPPGFEVIPLQIAIATRDLEGVSMLLEAEASPSGVGDPDEF